MADGQRLTEIFGNGEIQKSLTFTIHRTARHRALPIICALAVLPGCAAFFKYVDGKPFPFKATAFDAARLWHCVKPPEGHRPPVQAAMESPVMGIVWILDLPISIALDAVLLPLDVVLVLVRDPTGTTSTDDAAGDQELDAGTDLPQSP